VFNENGISVAERTADIVGLLQSRLT